MHRCELTDEQWKRLDGLLPNNESKKGRPWVGHRKVLNGMFWVLHTGSPWRDTPKRYGPWQTVFDRFNRWRGDEPSIECLSVFGLSSTSDDR